jgi:hypothetical protein
MTDQNTQSGQRKPWITPEIRELDVRETSGGNPYPDCQRS